VAKPLLFLSSGIEGGKMGSDLPSTARREIKGKGDIKGTATEKGFSARARFGSCEEKSRMESFCGGQERQPEGEQGNSLSTRFPACRGKGQKKKTPTLPPPVVLGRSEGEERKKRENRP